MATLPGIRPAEFRKLLLSVGKTTWGARPLAPVEVGDLCAQSLKAGASTSMITSALKMTDQTMVPKFVRLQKLPPEIRYLVSWGDSGSNAIGFSVAAQLARMPVKVQGLVAGAILKFRLTRDEMTSLIQLLERSGQSAEDCIDRIVKRRPTIRVQHVLVGTITSAQSRSRLGKLRQVERDKLLENVIARLFPEASEFVAKLSDLHFTIIGGKSISQTVAANKNFERDINAALEKGKS